MARNYTSNANVNDTIDQGINHAANAEVNLRQSAERLGKDVRDKVDQSMDTVKGYTKDVEGRIKDKPVESSLIALAAGFVLGMLFKR